MLSNLANTPLFLASVLNCKEAETALRGGAQIIDCKNSLEAPIGALSCHTVKDIVKVIRKRRFVSATVGNIIHDNDVLIEATRQMASTGVDFVKVGLFMSGDPVRTINKLKVLNKEKYGIVGLLFADENPDRNLLFEMANSGFSGVMLDTLNKRGDALPDLMSQVCLKEFIDEAHRVRLFVGVAGSLRFKHLEQMMSLKIDLLGFRGALCKNKKREDNLDENAVRAIAKKIELLKSQSLYVAGNNLELRT